MVRPGDVPMQDLGPDCSVEDDRLPGREPLLERRVVLADRHRLTLSPSRRAATCAGAAPHHAPTIATPRAAARTSRAKADGSGGSAKRGWNSNFQLGGSNRPHSGA